MKSRRSVFRALNLFLLLAMAAAFAPISLRAARAPLPLREPLWTFPTKGAVVATPALSADGTTLYVGSSDRRFYAIDTATGESKWTNSILLPKPIYGSAVIDADGVIYVGCMDGRLYAITDQVDYGRIEWRFTTRGQIATAPALGDDGTIYFGCSDNFLHAVYPDGTRKWSSSLSNNVATPLIADGGTIYVVAGAFLRSISDAGSQAAAFSPRAAIKTIPALGEGGQLYFGANDERVYGVNAVPSGDEDVIWKWNTGRNLMSSPVVGADGRIYIAAENSRFYALSTNGAVRWSVATPLPIRSSPSIGADGTIFAGCDDSRMYAISPAGKILWAVKTRAPIRSSAVIDALGTIYFGSSDRNVYAVETGIVPDSGEIPWQMFRKDPRHTARATECQPFLLQQPQTTNGLTGLAVSNGAVVQIVAEATSGGAISYQWRLNGVDIDSRFATNRTYTIGNAGPDDAGDYTLLVTTDCGQVESEPFTLAVRSLPIISSITTNQMLLAGATLTLNVSAFGSAPLGYKWFKDGGALPAFTSSQLSVTNAQITDGGAYFVVVTNQFGSATSAVVQVRVFNYTLNLARHPVAAGPKHSAAVLADGTLWTWGLDNFAQLGDASSGSGTNLIFRNLPRLIGTNGTATTNGVWASVAAGSRTFDLATNQFGGFSFGLQTNGTLWAWGLNQRGQLGLGTTNSPQTTPARVGTETNWVQVEGGANHSVGLRSDGSLWTWGANEVGQLGLGNTNAFAEPTRVGTESAWVEVRAGGFFTLARRADGTIWGWGANTNGQLGLGNTVLQRSPVRIGTNADWAGISAGGFHTLAVRSNGTLWAWGRNNFGQLGREDGNIGISSSPIQVGTNADWGLVEAGTLHSLALKTNGALFAWGANRFGQLGDGTIGSAADPNGADKFTPVAIAPDQTWVSIDASTHSLGQTADGNLWAWGLNDRGQVGDATGGDGSNNNNRSRPVLLYFSASTNAPSITAQPVEQTVAEGANATLSVEAAGGGSLYYQWYFNSNPVELFFNSNATNRTLVLENVQGTNAGFYYAVVTNRFGRVTSSVVGLTVTNASGIVYLPGATNGIIISNSAPFLISQPLNQTNLTNVTITLQVVAGGAAPLLYQWYFNSNVIAAATNATATNAALVLTNAGTAARGFYHVTVSNTLGAVTSQVARLVLTNVSGVPFPGSLAGSKSLAEEATATPRIGSIQWTDSGVVVTVEGVGAAARLTLEYREAVSGTEWKPVAVGQPGQTTLVDASAAGKPVRVYRIRVE